MAKCTKEQVVRWNAKLNNGFKLDLERFLVWNEKVAVKTIPLTDGRILKSEISWQEERIGSIYRGETVLKPILTFSVWSPGSTPGVWVSRGMGTVVKLSDQPYQKRNWNELAKFTADWNESRLMDKAKSEIKDVA